MSRARGRAAVPNLLALLHEAALDARLWPAVTDATSAVFDNSVASLGVVDSACRYVFDAQSHDYEDQRFREGHYLTPEYNPGIAFAAATPPFTVARRESLVSDRQLERLELYNDLMRPRRLWHVAVANLHRDAQYLAPIGLLRSKAQGPLGERDLRLLGRLAPHYNRAIRVRLRLREWEARAAAAVEMSDHGALAIVLVDGAGRIAELNRAAQRLLDDNDGLTIRDGALRASGPDGARLARLIFEAAGGAQGSLLLRPSGAMRVARPSRRRPLALVVSATRAGAAPFGRAYAVRVAFADPEHAPEADADLMARLYGLTRREAEIAALLVQGRSPTEVAATLAMTINTTRSHIRHILIKTGVDRLTDLLRLALAGPALRRR